MRRFVSTLIQMTVMAGCCLSPANASTTDNMAVPARAPLPVISTWDPVDVAMTPGNMLRVRITAPQAGRHLPVVILSHGNLLSRHDYRPLAEALARAGYVVIQPDHPDASNDGFAPAAAPSADIWWQREAAVLWLAGHLRQTLATIPGLAARIDPAARVVLGHSYGGHTAALAMGAQVKGPAAAARRSAAPAGSAKPPFRAAALLAPPGNFTGLTPEWKTRAAYLDVDWSAMQGPVLFINGTADNTALSTMGPEWHDDGFNAAAAGRDICLMRVAGAGHYLGGIDSVLRPPAGDATPERRARVIGAVIAFFDHALRRRTAAAAQWPAPSAGIACK